MQPIAPSSPMAIITYRGTSPMPTSWQTTYCIRPQTPPGGHRALPRNDCAGGAELFLCHRQELRAVSPRYYRLGWRKELVSCSLARTRPGNRQNQASLQCIEHYNKLHMYNHHNWYNWYNNHSQDRRMFPVSIPVRIRRTWIQCQS